MLKLGHDAGHQCSNQYNMPSNFHGVSHFLLSSFQSTKSHKGQSFEPLLSKFMLSKKVTKKNLNWLMFIFIDPLNYQQSGLSYYWISRFSNNDIIHIIYEKIGAEYLLFRTLYIIYISSSFNLKNCVTYQYKLFSLLLYVSSYPLLFYIICLRAICTCQQHWSSI